MACNVDPRLKMLSEAKYTEVRQWFGDRWENAIEAANANHRKYLHPLS